MAEPVPAWRPTLARWLHTASDLILLQLCFLVASLPVVTIVPAAISLQRSVEDMLLRGETAILTTFWPHFLWALRRFLVVSLMVLAYAALVVASIYLWASFDGAPRLIGLCSVLALGALCLGLFLSGLAAVGSADPSDRDYQDWRSLWRRARDRFAAQAMPTLACVVVMVGWLLLLARVPALGLIGSGLVPALLACWLNRISSPPPP